MLQRAAADGGKVKRDSSIQRVAPTHDGDDDEKTPSDSVAKLRESVMEWRGRQRREDE